VVLRWEDGSDVRMRDWSRVSAVDNRGVLVVPFIGL
jgi:hypothetical protein